MEIPSLTGTPRQVRWAEQLRAQRLRSVERHALLLRRLERPEEAALVERLGRELAGVAEARAWVDARDVELLDLARRFGWLPANRRSLRVAYAGTSEVLPRSAELSRWLAGENVAEPEDVSEARLRASLAGGRWLAGRQAEQRLPRYGR